MSHLFLVGQASLFTPAALCSFPRFVYYTLNAGDALLIGLIAVSGGSSCLYTLAPCMGHFYISLRCGADGVQTWAGCIIYLTRTGRIRKPVHIGAARLAHSEPPRPFPYESNLGWDLSHVGRWDYVHRGTWNGSSATATVACLYGFQSQQRTLI